MDYTWMTLMIARGFRLFVLIVRTFRNTTAFCALTYDYSNMMIVYGLGFTSEAKPIPLPYPPGWMEGIVPPPPKQYTTARCTMIPW